MFGKRDADSNRLARGIFTYLTYDVVRKQNAWPHPAQQHANSISISGILVTMFVSYSLLDRLKYAARWRSPLIGQSVSVGAGLEWWSLRSTITGDNVSIHHSVIFESSVLQNESNQDFDQSNRFCKIGLKSVFSSCTHTHTPHGSTSSEELLSWTYLLPFWPHRSLDRRKKEPMSEDILSFPRRTWSQQTN